MILVASGMDASANNLGRVSLKTIDQVTEETKSILSVYGRDYSDEQIIAFDDFLEEVAPIKSKIKSLVLPFLAKDDSTPISFGTKVPALYDIIRSKNTSINAAVNNSAKFCFVDGGIIYSGDVKATTGTYFDGAYIPSEMGEYGIGVFATQQAIGDFKFTTDKQTTQFYSSAGLHKASLLLAGMPEIEGTHVSMLRWSDSDNKIEGIVNGVVKVSRIVSDLTKQTLDGSNAMYLNLNLPTKIITQYYGMSGAEVISYSKMLMRLISAFGY